MIDWTLYLPMLGVLLAVMTAAWLVSVVRRDVSVVDSLWSLLFLLVAGIYYTLDGVGDPRALVVLGLVTLWAVRLSAHITVRNHGRPEDRRYRDMRDRHDPGFRFKSLYLVFGLQGALAWVIAIPLTAAMGGSRPLGWIDAAAAAIWLAGMVFEVVGDAQLARFGRDPDNRGRVLDTGLWRYTRHPNYFGECLLWWGFYGFALAAGAAWTVFSPILMTVLLLRVSGVALLEKDIGDRRPGYADYVRRTNAFVPGPPDPAH